MDAEARLRRERDLYLRLLGWSELEDVDDLLDEALAVTVQTLEATLGYLCVLDEQQRPAWERTHLDGHTEAPRWSTTVIDRVISTGRAVHTNSVSANPDFNEAESVKELSIEAVLALPLRTASEELVGVLYVHRAISKRELNEDAAARTRALARALSTHLHRLTRQRTRHDPTEPWRTKLRAEPLVGRSQALAQTLRRMARYVGAQRPVLLTGPTGCGKSTVARVLHDSGPRAHGPFVEVDVGALPESLFESELFGTVRGAFNDAVDRPGLVERADGGTLFLDEIGNIGMQAQAALLRFIDRRVFRRTGDQTERAVDVAIIAATNLPLEQAMEQGRFRRDLLFRLGHRIAVPGLDDRRDDLPELADHLVELEADRQGLPALPLSTETVAALLQRPWPGHIRELGQVLSTGLMAACDEQASAIQPWHLDDVLDPDEATPIGWTEAHRAFKRRFLLAALTRHDHNVRSTASAIGVSKTQLYTWVDELELKR